MKFIMCTILLFFSISSMAALTMTPYLQNKTTNSVWIYWEANSSSAISFKWGQSKKLAKSNFLVRPFKTHFRSKKRYLYRYQLTNLDANRIYYYQVGSGATYHFKTNPEIGQKTSFQFAAYSDTQWNPQVHTRIVSDGLYKHAIQVPYEHPSDYLDFVLVAGDLVHQGEIYEQYVERFFAPIGDLKAQIPYVPAIGNHEYQGLEYKESPIFLDYFNSPSNNSAEFQGHWHSFNYLNAHVITLNSNLGSKVQFRYHPIMYDEKAAAEQIEWLKKDLDKICHNPDINFVFTQFHHPVWSEMWVTGTEPYAQKVSTMMEDHFLECDKAGAIFSGHTHSYSRGQSDRAPLYFAVIASAGGRLDFWGEYENLDYPHIQKSLTSFGFVLVDVKAGDQPQFKVTRWGMGTNADVFLGFTQEDEFSYVKNNLAPDKPDDLSINTTPKGLLLSGSSFNDPDDTLHFEAQWEIDQESKNKSWSKIKTIWKRFQNIYNGEDTQSGKPLNQTLVQESFKPGQQYQFCVRYRDIHLNWGPWSNYKIWKQNVR